MLTKSEAHTFATEWVAAWNSHDLTRILRQYAAGIEFSSPLVVEIVNEPSGTLRGKAAVRAFWSRVLGRISNLQFELLDVFVGAGSITVHYRANFGRTATEVMFFDGTGKIIRSASHYDDVSG